MILYSKEQDGTLNVMICGKVTREPELKEMSKGSKVRFSVAYGKSKYMECEAWGDSDAGHVAGCLEKGDVVMVCGTHRSWEYNDKTYSSLTAESIFAMAVPISAPTVTPDVQDQAASGTWEELTEQDEGLPF